MSLRAKKHADQASPLCYFTIPIFNASQISPTPPIVIFRYLLHIKLPIQPEDLHMHLYVALDTCAGMSIGDYTFHSAIAKLYPECVYSLQPLQDLPAAEHIKIRNQHERMLSNCFTRHQIQH